MPNPPAEPNLPGRIATLRLTVGFLALLASCGASRAPQTRADRASSWGNIDQSSDTNFASLGGTASPAVVEESMGGVPVDAEAAPASPSTASAHSGPAFRVARLSANMQVREAPGRQVPAKSPSADEILEGLSSAGEPASKATTNTAHDEGPRQAALIYDARVHLAVFEAERAIDAAEKLAKASGGYLVHRDDRSITFRVPSEHFDAALEQATKLGDVLHREVNVRDVSDELRDLELRLRNAIATRDRLEQLLARAEKVAETLEVARELERVAGEIEQLKGRLKVLSELVAFSTITLQFEVRAIDQIDSTVRLPFPWLDHLGLQELLRL